MKTVVLGGGVAANTHLRDSLTEAVAEHLPSVSFTPPERAYTTDNAAMIAAAGAFRTSAKNFTPWQNVEAHPNLSL